MMRYIASATARDTSYLWRLLTSAIMYLICDALDREAFNRGNSVYFPRRVIPMLPEALSNGLCSLNPEVDRLCMVCEMNIDDAGNFQDYRFFPAVMHSHARLTYTLVAAMLEDPRGEDARNIKAFFLIFSFFINYLRYC